MKIKIKNKNEYYEVKENEQLYDVVKKIYINDYNRFLAVKVNNKLQELVYAKFRDGNTIEFLDITNNDGRKIYVRTLCFIFIKACKDIFCNVDVVIENSLNKGMYAEIKNKKDITLDDIKKIKRRMEELISSEMFIEKKILDKNEAVNIFKNQGLEDKIQLINQNKHESNNTVKVYKLENYYDTFYGYIAPNTNVIDKFDLKLFYPGVILCFPTKESNFNLPEYIENKKLSKVFKEAKIWGQIMDVANVGALNKKIENKSIDEMIIINEALHEKRIAYLADEIINGKDIKIVLIAGPSSSGKTTFANRLSIQLKVNGKKTYAVSLDDYFVDRELSPKDENGEYDFETINALDLKLFNEHLLSLMAGETVNIPVYNFIKGKREYTREPITLSKDHIIIVEGIHGLNEDLTKHIPNEYKYKIYISALTQLSIDNHNYIQTSDLRLIRRMVRDNERRGNDAKRTLELWDSVVRGAEKYIFPYQENADFIFNSALVYELCILKKYALPLIDKIEENSEYYSQKQRLSKFLSYFDEIKDESIIPNTSILKEFIGGSCFE